MKLRPLFFLVLAISQGACSSEKEPDSEPTPAIAFCGVADSCPPDTSGVDLTTPVSFRANVFEPIFQTSCNDRLCHGHQTLSRGGLWLGPESGEVPDELLESIVTSLLEPSATAPAMKNVEPGDPTRSFLMLKVDGCQNRAGLDCEAQEGALCDGACGDGMPQFDSPETNEVFPLSDEQRHTIRAWIAQGAQNN
jgi:hypothetical protein